MDGKWIKWTSIKGNEMEYIGVVGAKCKQL